METLQEAYQMAKSNDGAPGIDGVTFEAIAESGVESFLKQIRDELVNNTYPKPEDGCSRSSKATSTTTRYRETSQVWGRSVTGCWRYGGVLSAAGARNTGSRGRVLWPWLSAGFRNRARFIPFPMHALPPFICDKNRMR